ncbi:MAG: crotonobetainyl-CoA:carnitine CoA-transferase CaiB-like acyl-CoA transferase [Oceanicoccus sp.]|jgi:crotonobetainyl-CoA:carnitine CoA-transferase CaiB-like acyl-CoA transferase
MASALGHLKVLDLSRILAGPWASQILADFGAQVIKVERPNVGDDTRRWGPPYMPNDKGQDSSESAYFMAANRGKQSVCIDITTPKGQQQVHKLAQQCDIVIENFKTGGAAQYSLDYATLSALNPQLIYCSITGFGQTGPYKNRPGYDFLVQAMGGLMSVTGEPEREPQKIGVALTDVMTGLYASVGILASLAEREKSGLGQYIDLALLDVTAATLANQATNYLVGGLVPQKLGNSHPNIVPYQTFATSDGHCIVAVGNDDQFKRYCNVIGLAALADHPDYSTNPQRVKNRNQLVAILQGQMLSKARDEWLVLFEQALVPAGPINNIDEVFNDPQIIARDMRVNIPHPLNKDLTLPGNPIKLSRTPVAYKRPPPLLGEHDDEVFKQFGL